MKSYIEFSLDYEGICESVDTFEIDNVEETIQECEVDTYIVPSLTTLLIQNGLYLSEHRTEVEISWDDEGGSKTRVRLYNSPDWSDFDEHTIEGNVNKP